MLRDLLINTANGQFGVQIAGDLKEPVTLILNGTPTSRLLNPALIEQKVNNKIAYVSYERPGYGDSTRQPNRKVIDAANDVAAILDELEIDRVSLVGISGGGPHALAVASIHPDRVSNLTVVGAPAPLTHHGQHGFNYFAGMDERKIARIHSFQNDPKNFQELLEQSRQEILSADDAYLANRILAAEQHEKLSLDFNRYSYATMARAVENSVDGYLDDYYAMYSDWGFDLGAISIQTEIYHGNLDKEVPVGHAKYLHSKLINSTLHLTELGHMRSIENWYQMAQRIY